MEKNNTSPGERNLDNFLYLYDNNVTIEKKITFDVP